MDRRATRAAIAVVLALALLTVGAPQTAAAPDPGATESAFVARINQLRSSRGLPALRVDGELTGQARSWASNMASQLRIFHTSNMANGISADWSKLGENVGVGGDVDSLFQAFVNSPTHLANLVDPVFSHVGVGVVLGSDGRIYTAHRFMGIRAPAPPPAPPPPPSAAPPTTAPPTTAPPTTAPPTTAPPTTAPPTTAPPTTAPPTTAPPTREPERVSKLGAIHRIPELLRAEELPRADD